MIFACITALLTYALLLARLDKSIARAISRYMGTGIGQEASRVRVPVQIL